MATKMINRETQQLLAESAWLERVAYSLVRDEDEAKDVAQETYLAALTSAPPEGRPVRGWLGRVATNVVRMNHRGATRRAAREQAVGHVDDSAAKHSAQQLYEKQAATVLSKAVERLEEPLRSALLLRYVDDLTIAQVAVEQGVPLGTADSRIREGLKRLRIDLDAQADGDARPWLMALCPALGISETQAATAAATGGISMTKIALLFAALLSIGVLFMTQRGASGEDTQGRVSELSSSEQAGEAHQAGSPSEGVDAPGNVPFRSPKSGTTLAAGTQVQPTSLRARPSFEFRFLDADREHSDELSRAVDLESILYLASDCYEQFTERHPDFHGDSDELTVDIAVTFDESAGAVATNTELGVHLGSTVDDDFRECLAESSFGIDFHESPRSLQEGHVRLSLVFPDAATTAQEQMEGQRRCELELETRRPGLSTKDARFEDREFTRCLEIHVLKVQDMSDLEGSVISNADMQPCFEEAKARRPELDIARVRDEWVIANDDGILDDEEFNRCANQVFRSLQSQ